MIMSKSRRKTPIFGHTTSVSEAKDKAIWHRRHRRAERSEIKLAGVDYIARSHRAHSDPWLMDKDGKRWWAEAQPCDMRK
jgi:hypothetical protein